MVNVMLIGLPGSGKSTLAAKYVAEGYTLVSTDAARAAIGGDPAVQHPWPEVWAVCLALAKGADKVVYDATNILPEHRQDVMRQIGGAWIGVVVDTPLDECLRRNAARDRVVPEEVIRNMHSKYVPPSLDEGFIQLIRT